MQIKRFLGLSEDNRNTRRAEVLRFGMVGVAAVLIQYGVYLLMVCLLQPTWANTVGYIVSFVFNYIASTRFTFRVKSSVSHGAGFTFSHLINYLLQTGLLNLFLYLGCSKQLALLPMFAVSVPINFLLVRFFLKR
ncbi:MAG TPA: GtrA family protein [Prevotella sp.]